MKQARIPTESEFKRILAVIADKPHAARNRMAMMFSHLAGMRVGEIALLTWADVVTAAGRPRDRILLRGETTKSGEARAVFVGDRLRKELDRYLQAVNAPTDVSAAFLRSQRGKGFSPNTMCQLFCRLYAAAGLDDATSHSGRRAFITILAHSGVSAKVIMTLAGHKNLSTTQRYIEVNDEMLKAAANLL